MVESVFRVVVIGVIVAITIGIIGTVSFGWTLSTSEYLQGLTGFLHVIYYILPIAKLSPIIFCFIGLMSFRIIVSLIKTIWSLIPVRRLGGVYMNIFVGVSLAVIFLMDIFVVNKQKNIIKELTKENDKLKKIIKNKKEESV